MPSNPPLQNHGPDNSFAHFGSDPIPPGRWVYVGDYPTDPDTTSDSPPFQNGWRNVGGGRRRLRFRLTNENQVEVEGEVTGGAAGTIVTSLPSAEYWPDEDTAAVGTQNDTAGSIWLLQADGDLVYVGAMGTGGSASLPTGPAGGVLSGTYPNPGFASDMTTQAEFDARTLTAGSGLSGGGTLAADRTFDVNVDGSTIEINTDTLRVKADGITANEIAAGAVGASELASTAVTPATYGDATHVAQVTVDADGRITAATAVSITGVTSQHILLADGHATPFGFNDMLQMDDGTDFMWNDS